MNKQLKVEERLIVAADFVPENINTDPSSWIFKKVGDLAWALRHTRVCIKVGSALRVRGYCLLWEIAQHGIGCFADLKLCDIPNTLATDGALLRYYKPKMLTVMASSGIEALRALKANLPETEVLGVTALTSLKERDAELIFHRPITEAVLDLARIVSDTPLDGLISSGKELGPLIEEGFGAVLTLNALAVRPEWSIVLGDDQNPDRVMTPAKAIKAGADRIIMGRPITLAKDPYEAVMRTLDEIAKAL